jgi:hypothetical protein
VRVPSRIELLLLGILLLPPMGLALLHLWERYVWPRWPWGHAVAARLGRADRRLALYTPAPLVRRALWLSAYLLGGALFVVAMFQR